MTKKFLVLMWLCAMFAVQSCTSDQEPAIPEMQESDATISHMMIKFEDHIYETDVITQGDSITYLNEEYAEVYRSKIATNPNIAAITCTDSLGISYLEYFSTEKELLNNYEFIQLENNSGDTCNIVSRGAPIDMVLPGKTSPILARAELYDDKNFKDTKFIVYAATDWYNTISELGKYGFNDKASSIKVINEMKPETYYAVTFSVVGNMIVQEKVYRGSSLRPVLKCFHNSNYSGGVLYCVASPTGSTVDHTDNNLKTIGWNDRISSLIWLMVTDFSVFQGENPEIPEHSDC